MRGIDHKIETDVLVIGGGIAGILAALEARKTGCRVLILSKGAVGRSGNTPMAEGGIQASFQVNDSPLEHFKETMEAGRNINDPKLVEVLVTHAPGCMQSLEGLGVRFKKTEDGALFQYTTSGSKYPRCLWIAGGGPGLIRPVLKEAAKQGVKVLDDVMITKLLTSDQRVQGACGLDLKTGRFLQIRAKSVVLATGGNESLYSLSDASPDATGDGSILAYEAGAELADMEFIQFYPHALIHPASLKGVIIPEEVYYHNLSGGRLKNGLGEEFAHKYDPLRKENTTRDILARAIFTEIAEGRGTRHGGVMIDLTESCREKLIELLPSLHRYLLINGIDMFSTLLEAAPSAHYQCGGIKIDENAESTVKGLFAAGECTGGIDGANRLSSNALTEAVVFGMIAGKNAAGYALQAASLPSGNKQAEGEYARLLKVVKRERKDGLDLAEVKGELQKLMFDHVGVMRSREGLTEVMQRLLDIRNDKLDRICLKNRETLYNVEMLEYLELCNLVENALIVTHAARCRTESRGNHFRTDYPEENDLEWKKSIAVRK